VHLEETLLPQIGKNARDQKTLEAALEKRVGTDRKLYYWSQVPNLIQILSVVAEIKRQDGQTVGYFLQRTDAKLGRYPRHYRESNS
jgi:hypothetical protein